MCFPVSSMEIKSQNSKVYLKDCFPYSYCKYLFIFSSIEPKYYILHSVPSHIFMEASENLTQKMTQFNEMEKISEANIDDGHLKTQYWLSPNLSFHSVINVSILAFCHFKVSAILPFMKFICFDLTELGKQKTRWYVHFCPKNL